MTAAADYSAVETLRNGQRVEIRALRPQDRDEFVAAAGRLSGESLYRRFFAPKPHFSEKERAFFLDVDFVGHVALIAVLEEGGGTPVIVEAAPPCAEAPAAAAMSSPSPGRPKWPLPSSANIRAKVSA